MLASLESLLQLHGKITSALIDEALDLPSSAAFRHRFGTLVSAYARVGYTPPADLGFLEVSRWIRSTHPELMGSVAESLRGVGTGVEMDESRSVLHVNGEIRVSVSLCRHLNTGAGFSRWVINLDQAKTSGYHDCRQTGCGQRLDSRLITTCCPPSTWPPENSVSPKPTVPVWTATASMISAISSTWPKGPT